MKKAQAIALRRVSSKKQKENNHSLQEQDTSVQNMAYTLEVEIVKEWAMATSAKKGKNLKRKDLQEALSYCRYNPNVKYYLIDKVSRFMRELKMLFYFMVEFEKLGVKVIFCHPNQQKFNADNADAMYELARKAYEAESENEERSETSITKMKDRVRLGYYPFYPHQGYKKTEAADGLHIPDQPRFKMLKYALKGIANFEMTVAEALDWLYANGYRTPRIYRKDERGDKIAKGNRRLDLDHFVNNILLNPYYAGILKISDWPINERGLHEAMITPEEHEIIVEIVKGRKTRIKKQFNPEYPLNKSLHYPCRQLDGKITGILHKNGKGWSRKEYVCRNCKKRIAQELVHDFLDKKLSEIQPNQAGSEALVKALQESWEKNEAYREDLTKELRVRREELVDKRSAMINTLSANPDLSEEIKEELSKIKAEVVNLDSEVAALGNVTEDFSKFLDFAINYAEDLRTKWWTLPADRMSECKQLLFQGEIIVTQDGKVYTPKLSPIYSLQMQMSGQKTAQKSNMVELVGTAPTSASLSWLGVYRHRSFKILGHIAVNDQKLHDQSPKS